MSRTLIESIEAAAGSAPALADEERELDYRELRSEVRRIATAIREEYGVGHHLMLRVPMLAESVLTLLGISYSGNIPVPIDPMAPDDVVEYMRSKCGSPAPLAPMAPTAYLHRDEMERAIVADTAAVLFTSGTSGFPKGVLISQKNLTSACEAISEYLAYAEYRSAAVVMPLHYSYALLSQVFCMLKVGGFVRLFANFRNPFKFAKVVEEKALHTFCGVPSTYVGLVMTHRMKKLHIPSVRILCSAGAAMDRARYAEVKEIFPNATFFNNYGMTEAAPRISWISDRDPRFHEPTCGRPMRGVEVKVVDPKTHAPVSDGDFGVLVLRGPNVTCGYIGDPERTEEAFTEDGYLISGDIAALQDGYIALRGRADDLFNVAGEKVAPLEVERVLDACPGIAESIVVGVADETYGAVPIAFAKLDGELSWGDMQQFLKGRLPQIKWPRRLYEVRSLPRTPNGKLQRRGLSADATDIVVREVP
jgi:acyl-coenzyme A synthetase/AMP-(fatty) acid ligase